MTEYHDTQIGQDGEIEELSGPEQYLKAGEELLVCATDVQIKKFLFEVYLSDRRLFLVDQNEKKQGVFAKEIPVHSIVEGYLEQSPSQEPVLVLSIRTSDDDLRTMKMTFMHAGEDRTSEVEEWIHLIQHGRRGTVEEPKSAPETVQATPFIAPQARDFSETMVFPSPPMKVKDIHPPVQEEPAAAPIQPPVMQQRAEPPAMGTGKATHTLITFCYHCGRRLPPNANFCPFCGTRMHQQQPEESHVKLPLHQYREPESPQKEKPQKKRGWMRFFSRK
ncbi:MAG TPA: zinc ribbon domain-containing protein [Methanoregulaceae archaeon]|nr:zinc ribbon domain-containing protein [Methanoregulaceae archaeon]